MIWLLHNEARNLLEEAYEKMHDAKGIALAYEVSVPIVYRLAEQKARTGSVDLTVPPGFATLTIAYFEN